jgi:hypothetical protein
VLGVPGCSYGIKRVRSARKKLSPSKWVSEPIHPAFVKKNKEVEPPAAADPASRNLKEEKDRQDKSDYFLVELNRPRFGFNFRFSFGKSKPEEEKESKLKLRRPRIGSSASKPAVSPRRQSYRIKKASISGSRRLKGGVRSSGDRRKK